MSLKFNKIPKEYKEDFNKTRVLENMRRLAFVPYLIIVLAALYLLSTFIKHRQGSGVEFTNRYNAVFISMIALSLLYSLIRRIFRKYTVIPVKDFFQHAYVFIMFALCIGLTVLDLQVSDDYTGYTIGLLLLSFLIRTEPVRFIIMAAVGLLMFLNWMIFTFGGQIDYSSILPVLAVSTLAIYIAINREGHMQDMYLLKRQLLEASTRDPLTHAFNRRYMLEFLNKELAKNRRSNSIFSVLLFDLDFFKKINDEYSHSAGDEVLKTFADILLENIRDTDLLCRYGGEEFLIILSGADSDISFMIAERIRIKVSEFKFANVNRPVTTSIGISTAHNDDDELSVIDRADKYLYKAKNTGRNKTVR